MAISKPAIAPIWASGVTPGPTDNFTRPSDGFITSGWPTPNMKPARGIFNFALWLSTAMARYLISRGIPEWDAAEDQYALGSVVVDGVLGGAVVATQAAGQVFMLTTAPATTGTSPRNDRTHWDLYPSTIMRGLPNFDTRTVYVAGDVVRSAGLIYFCTSTPSSLGLAPASDPTHWFLTPVSARAILPAVTADWFAEIWAYRNVKLQRRWGFDHIGLPAGQVTTFEETWTNRGSSAIVGPGAATDSWTGVPWIAATGPNSTPQILQTFAATNYPYSNMAMAISGAGLWACMGFNTSPIFLGNYHDVVAEFEFKYNTASFGEIFVGLVDRTAAVNNGSTVASRAPAGFGAAYNGSAFQFYTHPVGGTTALTSLSFGGAPNTITRIRLESRSLNSSDNGAATVTMTINDDAGNTASAVLATDIHNGTGIGLQPFIRCSSSLTGTVNVGRVRYAFNRFAGDVFL